VALSANLVAQVSRGSIGAIVESPLVKAKPEVGSTLELTNHWKSDELPCQLVQPALLVMMVEVASEHYHPLILLFPISSGFNLCVSCSLSFMTVLQNIAVYSDLVPFALLSLPVSTVFTTEQKRQHRNLPHIYCLASLPYSQYVLFKSFILYLSTYPTYFHSSHKSYHQSFTAATLRH